MIDRAWGDRLSAADERWLTRGYFTVGYVVPQSGTAGIYGPSCEACGQLAVERINAQGGIKGREVRLLTIAGARRTSRRS